MTNTRPGDSQDLCELLPWYVNQTLNEEELSAMELHLGHCKACVEELAILRAVQVSVHRESVAVFVPKPNAEQFLANTRHMKLLPIRPRTAWVVGAVAAGFALLVAVLSWTQTDHTEISPGVYQTATDTGSGASFDYVLRISFESGLDPSLRSAALQALAPVSIAGPNSDGSYRVVIRLPARSMGQLEDYRRSIESDSAISSAAVVAIELPVESR